MGNRFKLQIKTYFGHEQFRSLKALPSTSGTDTNAKTEIIMGAEETTRALVRLFSGARSRICVYADSINPSLITGFENYSNLYEEAVNRGVSVSYLTEITRENLECCKELMRRFDPDFFELRHFEGIRGNFVVLDDQNYVGTASVPEGKLAPQLISSNAKAIIEQNQYVFESIWNRAITASDRIKEIEKGKELPRIENIQDPEDAQERCFQLVAQASKSVDLLLPSARAFHREERAGIIREVEKASDKREINVRILVPFDPEIEKLTEEKRWSRDPAWIRTLLVENSPKRGDQGTPETAGQKVESRMCIRKMDELTAHTRITMLVVDDRVSLVLELKNDASEDITKAIGFATYSNSEPTVLSYSTFFEKIWQESTIVEELRQSLLKEERSRRQAELLQDLLTHDLRNYNQISQLSAELLKEEVKTRGLSDVQMLADTVIKGIDAATTLVNRAKKLGLVLSTQNNTLQPINVIEVINNSMELIQRANQTELNGGGSSENDVQVRTVLRAPKDTVPLVLADDLLHEVFENLYSNSIKHRDESRNSAYIETVVEEEDPVSSPDKFGGGVNKWWRISVIDNGKGIIEKDRLFTRYLNRSSKGTGLGMSIVYALVVDRYGGRITVKDRVDGDYTKGAVVEILLRKA